MAMTLPSHDTARSWPGRSVLDRDGDTVGRITHIYLDRDSGQPEWALVAMPERGRVFVPLTDARAADDRVRVVVAKSAVREAPEVASGRELSQRDETRLYRHYGVADRAADQGEGARRAPSAVGRARGVATSAPARRVLSAAGVASALGAAAALAGRSRRRRRDGLAGALDGLVAVPAAAWRRRRRRQRVRAARRRLGGAAKAPVQAVGNLGAEIGRRAPAPPRPLSRRRRSRMAGNLKLAVGLATGYVLGAKAGRERYERLRDAARQVADRPEVQQLAGRLRSGLEAGVDKAASSVGDRLERARSAGPTSPDDDRPRAGGEARVTNEASQAGEELEQPEPSRAKARR
jgi:PRC-barrel domain